jgi:rhodanese-related sulfurtransferase
MNQKRIIAALLLPGILLVSGCAKDNDSSDASLNMPSQAPTGVYQKISAEEAYQMMEDSDDYILLDVRTEEEFEEARIEGAVLLPDYEVQDKAEKQLPDKDATILVYCRSGRRSAIAAEQLIDLGYTGVYDFGGIIDWPYDTVSGEMKGE